MGSISKAELESEIQMLDNSQGAMANAMRHVIKDKVEAFLIDEK
jgi:hypothetical protein